jgi:isopenicillin N synthase-like dioxygenase
MDSGVPKLSLADYIGAGARARAVFSGELMRGFQRYGFIILRNHPVPSSLLDEAYDLSAALFAQAEGIKRRYVGGARGYAPFGTEHAKNRTERDLKEFWQIGPEPANGDTRTDHGSGQMEPRNLWPESPTGFKLTFLALFDALQDTGRIILEALVPALGCRPITSSGSFGIAIPFCACFTIRDCPLMTIPAACVRLHTRTST